MRYYELRIGKPKLIGWKCGPFKFGAAKTIQIDPVHVMRDHWGAVVFVIRGKPYSLASVARSAAQYADVGPVPEVAALHQAMAEQLVRATQTDEEAD